MFFFKLKGRHLLWYSTDCVKFLGDNGRYLFVLGVTYEVHVGETFHSHKYMTNNMLRSLKSHVSDLYVRSAYFAFFHSVISYGIQILCGISAQVYEHKFPQICHITFPYFFYINLINLIVYEF